MSLDDQLAFLRKHTREITYEGLQCLEVHDRIYLDLCTYRLTADPVDKPWQHTVVPPGIYMTEGVAA